MQPSSCPRCLLFIESNTTGTGRLFAQAARQCGFRPVLLVEKPDRYPYLVTDGLDFIIANTRDLRELLDAVLEFRKLNHIAGIYSSSEYFVEPASLLAKQLQLAGPEPEAVHRCRDKAHQRACFEKSHIPGPRYCVAHTTDEVTDAVEHLKLPVVIKPCFGSGSRGVRLCRTDTEVHRHSSDLLREYYNERGMPVQTKLIVEEYIDGPEYSVEILHGNVIGITKKYTSAEPYFVETGHDFPAPVADLERTRLITAAVGAVSALGLTWGPAHVEVRLGAAAGVIVEVNPRLAGGYIPELIRLAHGIDLIKQTIIAVTGGSPELAVSARKYASIRFIVVGCEGTIREIAGLDRATRYPGAVQAGIYKNIGERVHIHHDFRDRIGHVIACGNRPEDSRYTAAKACSEIDVCIDPL